MCNCIRATIPSWPGPGDDDANDDSDDDDDNGEVVLPLAALAGQSAKFGN